MARRILDGMLVGVGIVMVVGVAFAVAWAGDIFTVDKDGTPKFALSDAGKITVGATESYVNLVIQNDEVAAEADNKLDITADVLTVEGIRLENVAVSANIESSGAGGLDTGSEAAGTWYYVWVVTNNTGTSSNGLLSTSSTAPTLPSGFTKKRRVGAVRNNGSGNFLSFVQEGNKCNYLYQSRVLSDGQSTGWATVNANAAVPPTSRRLRASVISQYTHNSIGSAFHTYVGKTATGQTQILVQSVCYTTATYNSFMVVDDCDTNGSQQIDYKITAVPNGGGGVYIDIVGYYDRI